MRLITKATLLFLFISLLVFGIAGIITYGTVMKTVATETDYSIAMNMWLLENAIREGKPLDALQSDKTNISRVDVVAPGDTSYSFSDTMAMHPYLKRLEPHRKLKITRNIDGEYFRFVMFDNFMERDDVSDGIINLMTRLFLSLGLILLLFSFLISSWLFRPFQKTLQKIRTFNLKDSEKLNFAKTTTTEFEQLNDFISQMTDKARRDYISLKEFSENAAHEMQTPIAVAKGKLELLIENPHLKPDQLPFIQSAQASLTKLSRLGQALSLLTKIENDEFTSRETTDFSEVLRQSVSNFEDLCELKGLSLEKSISDNVMLPVNASIADILVGNLLKNGVRYNLENGWIKIRLDKDKLVVENPGLPPTVPTDQLFERFRKNNQSGQSLGLGLAIAKKICEVNNWIIHYHFKEGVHQLIVKFDSTP